MKNRLPNYLRAHRKRTGLSQRELGIILGYRDEGAVYSHELFRSIPPLLIALAYEVVLQAPASELFAGLREAVEAAVEERIGEFHQDLLRRKASANGKQATAIDRKLEWLHQHHTASV